MVRHDMAKRERMKIQCDVCEKAEATVLCCADEAVLCWDCDVKVHAANKLAGKHLRVPLLNHSSQTPKCDICQEKAGYFFCLEDRALLCRQCDVSIHTATPYVSSHQRFLVTGVKVGLHQHNNQAASPAPADSSSAETPISAHFSGEMMTGFPPPHWPSDEMMLTTTATSPSEHEHNGGFLVDFPEFSSSKASGRAQQ